MKSTSAVHAHTPKTGCQLSKQRHVSEAKCRNKSDREKGRKGKGRQLHLRLYEDKLCCSADRRKWTGPEIGHIGQQCSGKSSDMQNGVDGYE